MGKTYQIFQHKTSLELLPFACTVILDGLALTELWLFPVTTHIQLCFPPTSGGIKLGQEANRNPTLCMSG